MRFALGCIPRLICTVLALSLWVSTSHAQQNLCEPRFGGGILNFSWECLNDTSMLIITPNGFQWQYAADSNKDGTSPNGLGANSPYEIYGIALKETNDSIFVVIKSNLPLAGSASGSALNGSIAYGDLFFNFSGKDFATAAASKELYAVRFVSTNDSGVTSLGLYKDVVPKAVGLLNQGFGTLQNYENSATGAGAVITYGDFPQNQTYYAKTLGLNVISEGTYLGPIQFLTANDLLVEGYNMNAFGGLVTVAFKFSKNLIIDQCGVPGGDGTSCLDCTGVACGKTQLDQCLVCGGDGKSCLDCAGVPFGTKVIDQCNVCGGDGKSCLDCAGVPFGNKVIDQCNVCGGDGTSCLDCKGVPFGTAVKDQCGVCGGNGTSCLDCKGVPNGSAVIDQCGVCGGDGKSCLDCKGIPNGENEIDRCGVCAGGKSSIS